mmetsp:Transcript_43491/g.105036  ORF Transcript_43491/g.105036 Transcript_43491/m.105036 type:complete len:413 (+) Transcript_43491:710-1948(+)|eukprot:CAMPEP_0113609798 /NCGR_PEP_ID=MMETSP0017_2-20120614/4685_1 /TAXON_ID=2856 /ORGANISM="Cylindrotheca closterium" /LENGTH=412 /DNA_ID=CAMNT_0000518643 /DNA_START=212 /DNA_END=1450 /DNA_ORIENTATION=- /assembly_acc=CAM_ASM_000147
MQGFRHVKLLLFMALSVTILVRIQEMSSWTSLNRWENATSQKIASAVVPVNHNPQRNLNEVCPFDSDLRSQQKYQKRGLRLEEGKRLDGCKRGEPLSRVGATKVQNCKTTDDIFCGWHDLLMDWYEINTDGALAKCVYFASRLDSKDVYYEDYPKPRCTLPAPQSYCPKLSLSGIWTSMPRNESQTESIASFYQEIGVWETFRQSWFRSRTKRGSHDHIAKAVKLLENDPSRPIATFEFGSGIGPLSFALLKNNPNLNVNTMVLSDIPAEHLYFGVYRLAKLREWQDHHFQRTSSTRIRTLEALAMDTQVDLLSLDTNGEKQTFDIIFCVTVFEHLLMPLQTAESFLERLSIGGILVEDYNAPAEIDSGSSPNTAAASQSRSKVMSLFQETLELMDGHVDNYELVRIWKRIK